jgi:opacity protein-like surface antigen
MRLRQLPLIAGIGWSAQAHAETTWHARVGVGLNPVASDAAQVPRAHTGFGASLSGFAQLPHRISAGVGFDWERYTFDSQNFGDPYGSAPRYTGEVLTHTRLMALVQWDILRRRLITPYVLAGLGYGWEDAELTQWQCTPALQSGLVVGGGAGLDLAVHELISVGVEYRIHTLPSGTLDCTLAFVFAEPMGPPSDFLSQRIGIALSLRY